MFGYDNPCKVRGAACKVWGRYMPLRNRSGMTVQLILFKYAGARLGEIYFEGYGWLPFEPTSPFRPRFYTTSPSGTYFSDNYNSVYADYMEMIMRYAYQGGYYNNTDEVTTKDWPSVISWC